MQVVSLMLFPRSTIYCYYCYPYTSILILGPIWTSCKQFVKQCFTLMSFRILYFLNTICMVNNYNISLNVHGIVCLLRIDELESSKNQNS